MKRIPLLTGAKNSVDSRNLARIISGQPDCHESSLQDVQSDGGGERDCDEYCKQLADREHAIRLRLEDDGRRSVERASFFVERDPYCQHDARDTLVHADLLLQTLKRERRRRHDALQN